MNLAKVFYLFSDFDSIHPFSGAWICTLSPCGKNPLHGDQGPIGETNKKPEPYELWFTLSSGAWIRKFPGERTY